MEAKLRFANTNESSFRKGNKQKIEVSLEFVKLCYVWAWKLRHREIESHALFSRPRTLINR